MASFKGYERTNGSIGVRNHIVVLPTVGCVNVAAQKIALHLDAAVPFLHHQGCTQLSPDIETVERVLTGIGCNPNVKGVLLVSLGCESVNSENLRESISQHTDVDLVRFQELGGLKNTVSKGVKKIRKMIKGINQERTRGEVSDLVIGVKCGASDTTSGIASNPAVGKTVDCIIEGGGTVIFGETTEILGAEHILAKRAVNEDIEKEIYRKVDEMEERVAEFGVDMRGGQPTEGNIRGGLTTIEDKSLGAIVKSGTKPIKGVLEYGERPGDNGLYFMDSPGREIEFITGVAAAGSQIILFSTGIGAPQGFPICPVIKVTGNRQTYRNLKEHIDIDVSDIIEGGETIGEAGDSVFTEILEVASGKKVKAETVGYDNSGVNSDIYVKGPVI